MVPDLDNRSTDVEYQCTLRVTRDRMPHHFNLAKPQCSSRQDVSRLGVKREPDTDSSIPPLRPSWVYDAVHPSSSHKSVSLMKILVMGSCWHMFAGGRTALDELAGLLGVLLEMEAQARLYLATYTDLLEISLLFLLMKQGWILELRLGILTADIHNFLVPLLVLFHHNIIWHCHVVSNGGNSIRLVFFFLKNPFLCT